jgi:hypothetical protein
MQRHVGATMSLEETGSLLIRAAVGLLFLVSAFACGKDASAREAAAADTALVFPARPELFLLGGIAVMALGGLSVLLGISRAVALALFLVPAAMIHFRKAAQAKALKQAFLSEHGGSSAARTTVQQLGDLAWIGNFTSALKNLMLIAPTLYLALAGVEPMLIGFRADGTLRGLLVDP